MDRKSYRNGLSSQSGATAGDAGGPVGEGAEGAVGRVFVELRLHHEDGKEVVRPVEPQLRAVRSAPGVAAFAVHRTASVQARWLRPDFAALPSLCQEARALATRVRLILRAAPTYNTLGMIIAAGLLHPVAAAVLMQLSSATVMALAARSEKPKIIVEVLGKLSASRSIRRHSTLTLLAHSSGLFPGFFISMG